MRVQRVRGLEGARGARGTVVVIDVLRAFTTAAYALAGPGEAGATGPAGTAKGAPPSTSPHPPRGRRERRAAVAAGAREIQLIADPAKALALAAADPTLVLVGEVEGRPIPGFHHGNSPEAMLALDLRGRTVLLRSSSGVQGALLAAASATHLFLGALVTATATARAARELALDVTLVAMGSAARPDDPEDEACSELLESLLLGVDPDRERIEHAVRSSPSSHLALDPTVDWISPGDLECALAIDRCDFALRAERRDGRLIARPG